MGRPEIDPVIRERLRAWLRYYREKYRAACPNDQDFAEKLGISSTTLSTYLSGTRESFGLDLLVKMRVNLRADLNDLIDLPPPAVQGGAAPPTPAAASPARAPRPRKRGTGGGGV